MLTAHFTTGSKKRPAMLDLAWTADGAHQFRDSFPVTNKREARKLANQHGATPWNF